MNKYPGWLFHLILTLTIITSTQSQCITPHNISGQCIHIKDCESLRRLLTTYRESSHTYLQNSLCEGYNGQPIVCCPPTGTQITLERPSYGPLVAPKCGKPNPNSPLPKIVNGQEAVLGHWPWMAALGYRKYERSPTIWRCGGSLISSRHVLTAAHCIDKFLYVVRLGDLDLDDRIDDRANPIDISIDKTYIHPDYSQYDNNIAMIRLKREVQFTPNLQPICLPFVDELINNDFLFTEPFVAGWGAVSSYGPRSSALMHNRLPIVSTQRCAEVYQPLGSIIDGNRVLCAGPARDDRNTCLNFQGNGGGPLMYPISGQFYIIGILSHGVTCGSHGIPDVFTKVGNASDFIMSHLN